MTTALCCSTRKISDLCRGPKPLHQLNQCALWVYRYRTVVAFAYPPYEATRAKGRLRRHAIGPSALPKMRLGPKIICPGSQYHFSLSTTLING